MNCMNHMTNEKCGTHGIIIVSSISISISISISSSSIIIIISSSSSSSSVGLDLRFVPYIGLNDESDLFATHRAGALRLAPLVDAHEAEHMALHTGEAGGGGASRTKRVQKQKVQKEREGQKQLKGKTMASNPIK